MSITINHVRENESDKTVFFTINISGENNPIEWHADTPLDKDPQAYLESIEDKIIILIFNRLYPDNDHKRFMKDGITEKESMILWISNGHKNKKEVGKDEKDEPIYEEEVIKEQEFKSTHPPQLDWIKKIEDATGEVQFKKAVIDMLKDQI